MAWEIEPTHSTLGFSVKHMMVTTVRGAFKQYSGVIGLNEEQPEQSTVDVSIDVASIETGQEGRDQHLRSPDFFDAEQFPTITYKSTKVERRGEDRYQLLGDLTIRGVTREVPLEITLEGQGKNPWGKRVAGFTITGSLNRKDFGLNWNVALESGGWLVSDQIKLEIDAEVVEAVPAAEAAVAAR